MYLQTIIIFASFLVDQIYPNAIEPFFDEVPTYMCWIEMVFKLLSGFVNAYVWCVRGQMENLVISGL